MTDDNSHDSKHWARRNFLRASSVGSIGALAGCLDLIGNDSGGGGGGGGGGGDGDGDGNGDGNGGGGGTPQSGTLDIGCAISLSGPLGATGQYIRDGYVERVNQINDEGGLLGREVNLIIRDDESDPATSRNQLINLIEQENVDLIIGGYAGGPVATQMQVAERYEMVYISMGAHLQSWQQGYEYSFGAPPLVAEWWYDAAFDWIIEEIPESERPSTAAVIGFSGVGTLGSAILKGTKTNLERAGIELVMDQQYELPLESASSLVNQAASSEAELFVSNSLFADGVQTIRAVNDVDWTPKMYFQGVGSQTPSWSKELGSLGNGVVSGTAMHPSLPFEGVDYLNERAQERYDVNAAPTYFMFGYSWMQALQQAVEGVGEVDQNALKNWLRNNEVSTVAGPMTFDERGLPERYSLATQMVGGVPELVYPREFKGQQVDSDTTMLYPYSDA
jgi:branched-chain amino acid transport system substrate-binding protein